MCKRTEEVWSSIELPGHRHSVGFFHLPMKAPTQDLHFYGLSQDCYRPYPVSHSGNQTYNPKHHPQIVSLVRAGPTHYSKTRLQRISGDTSKNFVIAVIRYIDIAKFVILYNEFVLHKENTPGMMNRCWTLNIHIITWESLGDNLKARGREWGPHSLIDIETSIFGFANESFLKLYLKCLVEVRIYLRCLSGESPLLQTSNNSYFVSRVIAFFFLLGEAMIVNNTFKYKVFVKTI